MTDARYDSTPRRVLRLPGVYRPQPDSHLLASALTEAAIPEGARVLDLCTGTGVLAVTAARLGAERVIAVDISRRATTSAWLNGRVRRLPVQVRCGDLYDAFALGSFDVVVANPPYVPCAAGEKCSPRWDAGPDGRDVLDPLCINVVELLRPGGFMLMVQSEFAGEDDSLRQLRTSGLKAAIVSRRRVPFGPILRRRSSYLRMMGLDARKDGEQLLTEQLVVIRADRPNRPS